MADRHLTSSVISVSTLTTKTGGRSCQNGICGGRTRQTSPLDGTFWRLDQGPCCSTPMRTGQFSRLAGGRDSAIRSTQEEYGKWSLHRINRRSFSLQTQHSSSANFCWVYEYRESDQPYWRHPKTGTFRLTVINKCLGSF